MILSFIKIQKAFQNVLGGGFLASASRQVDV